MGLFDVNMPLLYGEGGKAFIRLQKAILEMRPDHSILAFRSSHSDQFNGNKCDYLAPNPTVFRDDVLSISIPFLEHTTLIGTTLSIDMLICPVQMKEMFLYDLYLGILDCSMDSDPNTRLAILLCATNKERAIFSRWTYTTNLFCLHPSYSGKARVVMEDSSGPDPVYPNEQIDTETPLGLKALLYEPKDIKRVRISIVGPYSIVHVRPHERAFIQVDISSVLHDLEYEYVSSPPLVAENLLDTTVEYGSIEFSRAHAKRFRVSWSWVSSDQIRCSILYYQMIPGQAGGNMTREQIDFFIDVNTVSVHTHMTTPDEELGKTKSIMLRGPGTTSLEVWISMSRQLFIGRSTYVLCVHGKIRESDHDGKGKAGLMLWLRR
jgi:hypothetical protein